LGGSASTTTDYTAPAGNVVFLPGQTSAVVSINLTNDAAPESAETIVLGFGTLPGGLTEAPTTATH